MKKSILNLVLMLIPLLAFSSAQAANVSPLAAGPQAANLAPAQTVLVNFGGTLGLVYSPNVIFIHPGDALHWSGDFVSHPLVSDESLWTMVSSGTDFTFTFNTAGTYHFHCFFHGGLGMTGSVTVGYRIFIPDALK